ncbi:MAG: ImuA family protein [Paracoccaceae bacterium]
MTTLHDLAPRPAPADPFTLTKGRVHEAEGPGRRSFALFQTLRHPGAVLWVLPAHEPQRPMLRGLPAGLSERLLLLTPKTETDLLWCVEESLRAAPVALVIAEPQQVLSLTAGRRLQLAAEAGRTTGLMLIREGQGSSATETRWRCEPMAAPATHAAADSTLHRWSLSKNKRGTTGNWVLNWHGASAAFDLVPEVGERRQPAEPAR